MVDENIYNGVHKVQANNKMFMDELAVKECVLSLKIKKQWGIRQNSTENTKRRCRRISKTTNIAVQTNTVYFLMDALASVKLDNKSL